MGLFSRDFNRPGPGVERDAPPQRGVFRLWEVLSRDFGQLVQLNLLYQGCLLPAQALLAAALLAPRFFWLFFALSILAGLVVGGAKTAMSFCVGKMLRDEPGFLWQDFKTAFVENAKPTAIVGALSHAVTAAQLVLLLRFLLAGGLTGPVLALLLVSVLVFHMVMPYYYLQSAYLQLGNGALLKNSVLLAVGNLPRSFCQAAIYVASGIAIVFFQPVSLVFATFVGYAIPLLMGLLFIWPPVNKTFKIAETLKNKEETEQ